MLIFIFLILIGAFAGLLSGLLGIGGGLIIVPALTYFFKYTDNPLTSGYVIMQSAIASSLLAIALTACASVLTHQRCGSIRWDIWKRWVLGLCVGALIAISLVSILSTQWLSIIFAIFLIGVAIRFFIATPLSCIESRKRTPSLAFDQPVFMLLLGIFIGLFSGLLGVGGGILMTPILLSLGCSMPESAGTSSASMLPLAFIAGIAYVVMGIIHPNNFPWMTGYIYWPAVLIIGMMGVIFAPLGVKLSYKISITLGRRLLALLLLMVAIDILV